MRDEALQTVVPGQKACVMKVQAAIMNDPTATAHRHIKTRI